jgi:hypothetical protein
LGLTYGFQTTLKIEDANPNDICLRGLDDYMGAIHALVARFEERNRIRQKE